MYKKIAVLLLFISSSLFAQNSEIKGTILDEDSLKIIQEHQIQSIFTNEDYEPYALKRDAEIHKFLNDSDISFQAYKDQVIFAKNDILKIPNKIPNKLI